jgi:hypothetical protein
VISLALWVPLFHEDGASPQATVELETGGVRTGVVPPAGLGFAASRPTASYAWLDLTIRNPEGQAISFAPASIEVHDQSGGRLAWATDDAEFLAASELAPGSTQVQIWVALPAGRVVDSVDAVDAHVEVR